jgi:RND family efflux transporter MFP subunit
MRSAKLAVTWVAALTAALALTGCSGEPPLAQTPPVEVVISQPVTEEIEDWDVYTGTVDAKESLEVRARVRGHVKEVCFKEGQEIAAGTELFILDAEPFQADLKKAQGELTKHEADLKLAEEKILFYKPLAEKGSVSKEELLKVIADKEAALGNIATSRGKILDAELNIGYCTVKSDIAGKVGEALFTKGDLVNSSGADSLLATVVGVDPMYVYFYVHQNKLQEYRELLKARITKDPGRAVPKIPVEMAIGSDPRYAHKGFVDFVDNRVDPATSSIKVRARFDNPKGEDNLRALTPGLFARVRVSLAPPYKAILIADRAILADQNLKYVLVVNRAKDNLVERVDIKPADRVQDNGLRVVTAGLNGNEWLIVEGVNRARPGVKVAPKESPMPRRPTPKPATSGE